MHPAAKSLKTIDIRFNLRVLRVRAKRAMETILHSVQAVGTRHAVQRSWFSAHVPVSLKEASLDCLDPESAARKDFQSSYPASGLSLAGAFSENDSFVRGIIGAHRSP
jgi:hypothetical protein